MNQRGEKTAKVCNEAVQHHAVDGADLALLAGGLLICRFRNPVCVMR